MMTLRPCDHRDAWESRFRRPALGGMMAALLLASFSGPGTTLVRAEESIEAASAEVARWAARSTAHPFDDELRLLALDVVSPKYREVLGTMISTDLEAEWQRVATVDNFETFLARHGGKEKVVADAQLKSAFEVRQEIAAKFLDLLRTAYDKQKREPPFNDEKVAELCKRAGRTDVQTGEATAVPIRALMPVSGAEQEWPQFRGPAGQGIVLDGGIPLHWSAESGVAWKQKLPGAGNSSPIVWRDKVFVTAASEDGQQRWLVCYSASRGELLWQYAAPPPVEPLEKLYQKNTYASSTPVTDGERVIGFFGNSGMVCCDLDGRKLWHQRLGAFPTGHGPGTSPILYRDKIIVIQDQNSGDSVAVALDKHTGQIVWRQQRAAAMCWSTPAIVHVGQRDELLYNGSHVFISYDPETGDELWRVAGVSRESIPMPVIGGGRIFSVSGRNGPMLAIRPGGTGDVSETHTLWSVPRGGPHVPTPVYVNGRLFMVNDLGIASCRDASSGKLIWQERLPGRFSMSMLSVGDKLLVTSETGTTHLLKAADKFVELAVNELNETVLATPAIVRGRIYFRTAENLICVGQPVR